MRTLGGVAAAVVLLTFAVACGGDSESSSESAATDSSGNSHQWDFLLSIPIGNRIGELAQQFADEVRTSTDGQLDITVHPTGELPFAPTDALKAVQNGDVQMVEAYSSFVEGSLPVVGLPGLPLLVTSIDELKEVMPLLQEDLEQGFSQFDSTLLFWFPYPTQNLFGSGNPLHQLTELKGRKVRASSAGQAVMLENVGASPVTMTGAEVASALQTGVVDAVISSAFFAEPSGWGDFLDWGYTPGISAAVSYVAVSSSAFAELPADVQETVKSISAKYQTMLIDEVSTAEDKFIQKLKDEYGVEVDPGDSADLAPQQVAMEEYWDTWAQDGGGNLPQLLDQVKEQVGR